MSTRDNYFRCRVCRKLFADDDCVLDEVKGYQCPNGCVEPYEQPRYESPLNYEDTESN